MTNPTAALSPQNSFSTTLSSPMTNTDTTIYLATLPTATEGYLTIDEGLTTQEILFYNSKGSNFCTIPSLADRGLQGSTSGVSAHSSGSSVKMKYAAQYLQALANGNGLSSTAINSTKVDWTSTGGIWWQELGRTTLAVAGNSIDVTPITAKKYLKVLISANGTGGSGVNIGMQFNGDTATNYAHRVSANGGADSTGVSQTQAYMDGGGALLTPVFIEVDIINIATAEKLLFAHLIAQTTAGAGTAPTRYEWADKWANTSTAITRVNVINPGGTGTFTIGSQVIVLGHD